MANEYRVSQVTAEVLTSGSASVRVSQAAVEVLHGGVSKARVSQFAVEVLRSVALAAGPFVPFLRLPIFARFEEEQWVAPRPLAIRFVPTTPVSVVAFARFPIFARFEEEPWMPPQRRIIRFFPRARKPAFFTLV